MFLEKGPGVLFMTTKIIASLGGEKMSRAKKGNDQKAILLKAPHALHSHFRQLAPGASSHLLASTSTQLPLTCIVCALSTLQRGLVQSTRALYPWMASYERPFMLPLVYISARTNQGFLCTLCIVYISSLFSSKNIASAYTPLLL